MTILRDGRPRTSPLEMLNNNHLYEGKANNISIARNHSEDFECDFNMEYYPFDIQICTMNFILGVCVHIYLNNW